MALYEATFEKYHRGTGRVPGDANWPGKKLYPDYSTDIDQEINWFLDQAMAAAEQVADKITLTENTGLDQPDRADRHHELESLLRDVCGRRHERLSGSAVLEGLSDLG